MGFAFAFEVIMASGNAGNKLSARLIGAILIIISRILQRRFCSIYWGVGGTLSVLQIT